MFGVSGGLLLFHLLFAIKRLSWCQGAGSRRVPHWAEGSSS